MQSIMRKIPLVLMFTAGICGCAVAVGNNDVFSVGQKQLDEQQWQAAQTTFSTLAQNKGDKQDAALYWLAYSQFKNNQPQAALKTIGRLKKQFSTSRWLDDAQALRVEIKDKSGDIGEIEDDELKLYAINALMNSSSDKAVSLLSNIINGDSSPRLAKRAMFVLSQMNNKQAFKLISATAASDAKPVQQLEAIKVLGLMGDKKATQVLQTVYSATSNTDIKAKVLRSFMLAGEPEALVAVAKTEQNGELKNKAIKMLGNLSATAPLLKLYQDPGFADQRATIIKSIAIGGDAEALFSLVKTESDPDLKVLAVRRLGLTSPSKSGEKLQKLYIDNNDTEVREAVIRALFLQSNATALITIIKQEKDPQLKRKALKKLTLIDSDEAIDYFSKILNSQD